MRIVWIIICLLTIALYCIPTPHWAHWQDVLMGSLFGVFIGLAITKPSL